MWVAPGVDVDAHEVAARRAPALLAPPAPRPRSRASRRRRARAPRPRPARPRRRTACAGAWASPPPPRAAAVPPAASAATPPAAAARGSVGPAPPSPGRPRVADLWRGPGVADLWCGGRVPQPVRAARARVVPEVGARSMSSMCRRPLGCHPPCTSARAGRPPQTVPSSVRGSARSVLSSFSIHWWVRQAPSRVTSSPSARAAARRGGPRGGAWRATSAARRPRRGRRSSAAGGRGPRAHGRPAGCHRSSFAPCARGRPDGVGAEQLLDPSAKTAGLTPSTSSSQSHDATASCSDGSAPSSAAAAVTSIPSGRSALRSGRARASSPRSASIGVDHGHVARRRGASRRRSRYSARDAQPGRQREPEAHERARGEARGVRERQRRATHRALHDPGEVALRGEPDPPELRVAQAQPLGQRCATLTVAWSTSATLDGLADEVEALPGALGAAGRRGDGRDDVLDPVGRARAAVVAGRPAAVLERPRRASRTSSRPTGSRGAAPPTGAPTGSVSCVAARAQRRRSRSSPSAASASVHRASVEALGPLLERPAVAPDALDAPAPMRRSPRDTIPSAAVASGSCQRISSPWVRARLRRAASPTLRRSSSGASIVCHWNGVLALGTNPPTEAVTEAPLWWRRPRRDALGGELGDRRRRPRRARSAAR